MKSFTESTENNLFSGRLSSSSLRNFFPKSKKKSSKNFFNSENTPPPDPNIIHFQDPPLSPSIPKQKLLQQQAEDEDPPVKAEVAVAAAELECQRNTSADLDPPVKVVARIRPANDNCIGGVTVKKVSTDLLSVSDRKFSFDSVLDSNSNQEDVFNLVGMPLVKNALAGYNTLVLSYGQTGSGKTYTMWGPPSAMVEDPSPVSQQGIVPRIFQMLFSEIEKEQESSDEKQTNYQCRCSFLEIYNDQIGDLLDPMQRNLEITDDPRTGLHVENLTEEHVSSYEDVTQILIKGLSSRKVGATSINSKSSRSHVVFTFTIESWCKGTSSKCVGSSKISRISLIDLAGMDRTKHDDAGRQFAREGKNIKKSLSQLGKMVNNLGNGAQPGNLEVATNRGSCLTHLLQDSLGGNSKLTVICNICPENRFNSETLRTLRFGQRVRSIKNVPVINEISEDYVNDLSDQIRQLKEELIRTKLDVNNSMKNKNGHFKGRNARDSLNHLRVSLNRSLMLPRVGDDSDNEMDIGEDDVRELHEQLKKLDSSCEEKELSDTINSSHFASVDESFETDSMSEDEVDGPHEIQKESDLEDESKSGDQKEYKEDPSSISKADSAIRSSISISLCRQSPALQEPTLSESPKIGNTRKSMAISSACLESQNDVSRSANFRSENFLSMKPSELIRSSLRSSKMFQGPTESLAASLQRGLQIIDQHQQNKTPNRSSVSFSFEHLALKPCPEVDGTYASVEKLGEASPVYCASCKKKINDKSEDKNAIKECDEEMNSLCLEDSKDRIVLFEKSKLDQNELPEIIKEVQEESSHGNSTFDIKEKEALLQEIECLKAQLKSQNQPPPKKSIDKLRSSMLAQSLQFRKSLDLRCANDEELEKERQRWMEMESEWISITDDLRIDLESNRQRAEKVEMELALEKKCIEELDDALSRSVLGHARMVEHYADLQEKHNDLLSKHRAIMEGIAEVKKAAAKAGNKKGGSRFAKSLAAELSVLRVDRDKERELLKKENKNLKVQLRDTAEAVHAAGELLVRLREAEHATSVATENFNQIHQENDKLKKQLEKVKRKHKMEMITMKQYLAESRLPESALRPLYREDSEEISHSTIPDDDQAWRAEFGPIYQEHF